MNLVSHPTTHQRQSTLGVVWQETTCPQCGGGQRELLLEAADPQDLAGGLRFAVVRCQACSLCYTDPRPDEITIRNFYPISYRPHQMPTTKKAARWSKRYPALPRWLVRKHGLTDMPARGRLLDFGCGGGLFLQQMRQSGWEVAGVDFSAATVDALRHELGLQAYEGSLPHAELEPGSFDVITMWHSLEHCHAPRAILEAASDLLKPGGKLIVAVPNIDSLPFRWFGSDWYGLDLPRHLIHFTPATLERMLCRAGFEVQSMRMVRHSSWLRMSARLAAQRGRQTFLMRLLRFKTFSRWLTWYNYFTQQSDTIMAVAAKR